MNTPKLLANRLNVGDLVSIVAPSSGIAPLVMHRIEKAKSTLEGMGFKVKFERNSLKNNGHLSGTVAERVDDLHSAFSDENVKAIICTIGGNHSNQLLMHLDWELIKKNPKIFLGYSDITVLHHAIYNKTGLVTFYGPSAIAELGEFPEINSYNLEYFKKALIDGGIGNVIQSTEWTDEYLDWLKKEDIIRPRTYVKNEGFEWWKEGKATAEILGGTIPSIIHLAGTEFYNEYKDRILFLDLPCGQDAGKGISISDLDAYMADLYNLNVFSEIRGLVIGRAYSQSQENLGKIRILVEQYTKDASYPILYGIDIGHTTPMITLPFGAKVSLDSEKGTFEIRGPFIS